MRSLFISGLILFAVALLQSNTNAEEKNEQIVRGQIVCIELDETGNANVAMEFTECSGLLYLLGVKGNLYSLHGTEEEIEKIKQSSKSRMGYRVPLRLKGKPVGHERAWQLYTPSLEQQDSSIKTTVTGTVLCVFANYKDGTVKPKVAGGPCNEAEPHAHFIQTDEGEIYALQGTQEDIVSIEKDPKRENVTLKGKLRANESGWILYVN